MDPAVIDYLWRSRSPRDVPPPWMALRIKRNHPIARDLALVYLPTMGQIDLASGVKPTAISRSFVRKVSRLGVASDHTTTRSWKYLLPSTLGNDYTALAFCNGPITAFKQNPIDNDMTPSGGSRIWQIQVDNSFASFIFFNTGGSAFGTSGVPISSAQAANGFAISGKVSDSDKVGSIMVDGVRATTTGTGTVRGQASSSICVGDGVNSSQPWSGFIYLAAMWNRRLSDDEERYVHRDPFCIFEPDLPLILARGPAAVELTPGVGAITITGLAPVFAASVEATPGAGAIAVAGLAPSFSASVLATPGAGGISFASLDATFSASFEAAPGSGAISIAGLPAGFSASVVAEPGTGGFSFAGLAPAWSQDILATPGAGAIVITGLAPSWTQDIFAAPDAGAITITGFQAEVSAGVLVVPGVGSLQFAGLTPTVTTFDIGLPSARRTRSAAAQVRLLPVEALDRVLVVPGTNRILPVA